MRVSFVFASHHFKTDDRLGLFTSHDGNHKSMDFITDQITRGADKLFKKDPRVEALLHPSPDDLDGLDYSIENLRGPSNSVYCEPELVFQYSAALISHVNPLHIKEGITLMEGLVFQHWQQERRRASAALKQADVGQGLAATAPPSHSESELDELPKKKASPSGLLSVYYYYIALGWLKLSEAHKAKVSITRMLELEPGNPQGRALEAYVDQQQTRDGVLGLAGMTAAVAAVAVVLGSLRK